MIAREVRELGASLRFRVTLVLTLAAMALSAWTSASFYQAETRQLARLSAEHADAVEAAPLSGLLHRQHPVYKPPWKLAFLSEGRQRWVPDVYLSTLNVWIYPELTRRSEIRPGHETRQALDWVFAIRVILSMSAFLLGYDAICGGKQRSLLKLVLSYPVPRWPVVTAKLCAVWACVAAPFVLGAAAGLLILSTFGGIDLSGAELLKCGLTVAIGLWASAVFAAMAVWISILAREPVRSLAILALLWVTAVVVIPGAGGLVAQTVLPLPTDQEVSRDIAEIGRAVEMEHQGTGRIRDADDESPAEPPAAERATAMIQNQRYRRQEEERRRRILDELAQVELAYALASVSPMFLVQDLVERAIGSGPSRDRSFVEQAWDFGDRLAARVLALDEADPDSPNLWQDLELRDPQDLHLRFVPGFVSGRTVTAGDLPRFEFRERSPGEGLRDARLRIALFALITAAVSVLLLSSFNSFDVGSPR